MLKGYLPNILEGAVLTIEVALASLAVSIVLGLVGALCKLSSSRLLNIAADIYSTVIRGVPDLVWMFMLFYGGQMLLNDLAATLGWGHLDINPFIAGVLTLGFIFGAYMAETFRGAILAVPIGQSEAGQAFGMGNLRIFFRIVFPQMVRFAIPSFSNNWMVLVKATALISVIGLNDMMYRASTAKSATQQPLTVYLVVATVYLLITTVSTVALDYLARRYSAGVRKAQL